MESLRQAKVRLSSYPGWGSLAPSRPQDTRTPPFAVRARCQAAAHFQWDDVLRLNFPEGPANYQSEYTGGEDGRSYAVTIHGEIRGEGATLQEVEVRLAERLRAPLPVLAVASNAAMGEMLLVASHGLDLSQPQPFLGYWTPGPDEWFPAGERRIDLDAARKLLLAATSHSHAELLLRAYEAYRRALSHWFPEELLFAGEFLYIAAETLSRFVVEERAAARGMTPKNLARLNKVPGPDSIRSKYLREEVFGDDTEAFEALQAASDGFEHGYMSITEVRNLFQSRLARSMSLVRRALIEAAGVGDAVKTALINRYEEPRGLPPTRAFVRGTLTAVDPSNPPTLPGGAIELDWKRPKGAIRTSPAGERELEISLDVKVRSKPDEVEVGLSHAALRVVQGGPEKAAGD